MVRRNTVLAVAPENVVNVAPVVNVAQVVNVAPVVNVSPVPTTVAPVVHSPIIVSSSVVKNHKKSPVVPSKTKEEIKGERA